MSKTVDLHGLETTSGDPLPVASRVDLKRLRPGPRVRLGNVNPEHVEALVNTGGAWPPLVVRRIDNTIIDGYYRFLAARRLGHTHVECLYFDGGCEAAFLESVRRNLAHGLPLSLRERALAARRILAVRPEWSDRRLGELCGLSPATVGRLRGVIAAGRAGEKVEQLNARVGRDGKRYPVDRGASRDRIITALRADPDRSLRSVAQETGASPSTVRAIKAELCPPLAPADELTHQIPTARPVSPASSEQEAEHEQETLATSAADFTRWFERTDLREEWQSFVHDVPAQDIDAVAREARCRARLWGQFASSLEARVRAHKSALGA